MITNWFTLTHLVNEWRPVLVGGRLTDAYSQNKGSLVLVFERDDGMHSLNISVQAPHRHLFLYEGSNRARRNVADLFPAAIGERVTGISLAHRDRVVTIELTGGMRFLAVPFGPRANVFLEADETTAFRGDNTPPELRPAPELDDLQDATGSLSKRLPLFPAPLMRELLFRMGAGRDEDARDAAAALQAARELERELLTVRPVVYWEKDWPEVMSPIPLRHLEAEVEAAANPETHRAEAFQTVNDAVRTTARNRMARARFRSRWKPLVQRVEARLAQSSERLDRMLEELDKPSRADKYERYAHLLMAQPQHVQTGLEHVELEDIIAGTGVVGIDLDPALSAVRNAERYYDKARRTRLARENAMERLEHMEADRNALKVVSDALAAVRTLAELDAVEATHKDVLADVRSDQEATDSFPYRKYALAGGYEVWVGRNARQNDQLTLRDSQKYDLWLHARGVAGSHTVLRVKGRNDTPPRYIVEQAAAIAAYYSKARTSGMAPVIVTERKFVRKPRKALPGTVVVEREEVIMIEPGLPTKMKTT